MTNTFSLKFDTDTIVFNVPDHWKTNVITPRIISPPHQGSPAKIIRHALEHPIGVSPQLLPSMRVSIAVNDKTRPVPNQVILPELLHHLHRAGIPHENIKFFIATGTHTPMVAEEFTLILPEEIIKNYSIVSHDCDDEANLLFLGMTSRNTPVFTNKNYYEADLRIVVGNIEPHHFMGFSGGVKSAAIGLSGRKTINSNHAFLKDSLAKIGLFENNPMRQDIEEIGKMGKIDLALNVIMNDKREIIESLWGSPYEVMLAGIPMVREICQVKVENYFDLIIASAGGYPKDINLYQAQKALTNAATVVKEGGVIILLAGCREGIGSPAFTKFMEGVSSWEQVFEKFEQIGFAVGPHKAYQIARIAQKANIILVSKIAKETVTSLLLTPADNISEAIILASKMLLPNSHNVGLLPQAVMTIPYMSNP